MDEGIRESFGNRVRDLRKQQGYSLRGFAAMIGIDKGFLVDIELGRKSPTLDTLAKIASGFEITLPELLASIESAPINIDPNERSKFKYQTKRSGNPEH